MREVGKIEARHEARYLALAAQVSGNKVFTNDQPVAWICANWFMYTLVKKPSKFAQYVLTHKLSSTVSLNPSNL